MSDLTEFITGLPCFKAPSNITPLGGGITNTNVTVEDEDCKYVVRIGSDIAEHGVCLLYTSPSPRDAHESRMPSSA